MRPGTQRLARFAQIERGFLLAGFALVGLLWVFFGLGEEIGEGETAAVDKGLIAMLGAPGHGGRAYETMRDITAFGGLPFLLLWSLGFALALLLYRKKRAATIFALTAIGAQLSIEILKYLYDRARPSQQVGVVHGFAASFPSGHTAESTAIGLTAAAIIATLDTPLRVKVLAYGVALLVIGGIGVSRVYLGAHWPTDVFGGWTLGSAWALLAWTLLRRKNPAKGVLPD